jgi:hypothetical protein
MENKYYTPEIEELHVGMYCEWLRDPANEIYIPVELTANMLSLTLNTTGSNFEKLNVPGPISYRVKYLDREDIESLGWVKSLYKTTEVYQLDKFVITSYSRLEEDGLVIDISSLPSFKDSELRRIFRGIIKNKSELKRVMEQLTINKL